MTSAKGYINVAESLSQISETSKKVYGQINYDGMTSAIKIIAEQMKSLEGMQINLKSALKIAQIQMSVQPVISEMMSQQYIAAQIFSNGEVAKQLANVQSVTAVMANLPTATRMLKDVQLGLANSNIGACVDAIQKSLDSTSIAMADVSFIKTTELMKSLGSELVMPVGLASMIAELNKSSLERLAHNSDIIYKNDTRKFVSVVNEEDYANAIEINVICRMEDLLDVTEYEEKFTENELMNFMTFLDESPMLAMNNPIGKKIYDLISEFPYIIGFDKEKYYHCRARNKDDSPYVWEQMRRAPYGVTYPGRYNHAGQAYFYFSDNVDGAKNEILRHMSNKDKDSKVLQVVELGVNAAVRLIDLSGKNRRGLNTFFKYIRFPLELGQAARPREYLIPCFVSECCRAVGINGIKYYGGKDYSNYVTWQDSYYSFIRNV